MTYVEQIREAMEEQRIGLEPLAVAAGIHSNTLRKALAGDNVTVETIRRLAAALGIDLVVTAE